MITDNMFGGHMILNKDFGHRDTDAFSRYDKMIPSSSYRYPGGTVTELLDYRDGSLDAIFATKADPSDRIVNVKEAVTFANDRGVGIDFVLPTKRFFASTGGNNRYFSKSEVDELINNVDRMIRGKFGDAQIDKVTIGNEYWYADDPISAQEYGKIANYMAKGLQARFGAYAAEPGHAGWVQPQISVQAGAAWLPGDNEIILSKLDMQARAAIDVVEAHWYAKTYDDADGGRIMFKNLKSFEEAPGFRDIDIYISEWNTHNKPGHDAGMKQASSMLRQFDTMVENGVDHATIWGTNYKNLGTRLASMSRGTGPAVDPDTIDVRLTAPGEVYRLMSESLPGTAPMDLGLSDVIAGKLPSANDVSVHSYESGDRIVVFLASRTGKAIDLNLDLDGIAPGYGHVSATHMTTIDNPKTSIDEGNPAIEQARPELSTLNQRDLESSGGAMRLKGFDIVKLEFTRPGAGAQVSGTDQPGRAIAVDDDLLGSKWGDRLSGGAGNDRIEGVSGQNILIGGSGNDHLDGGPGNDVLIAGTGNNWLTARNGTNVLIAGTGKDSLIGGDGRDMMISADGHTRMVGGKGASLFKIGGSGIAVIEDFNPDKGDRIDFGDRFGSRSDIMEQMEIVPGEKGGPGNVVYHQPDGGQTIIIGGAAHVKSLSNALLDGSSDVDRLQAVSPYLKAMDPAQIDDIFAHLPSSDMKILPDLDFKAMSAALGRENAIEAMEGSGSQKWYPEATPPAADAGGWLGTAGNSGEATTETPTIKNEDPAKPAPVTGGVRTPAVVDADEDVQGDSEQDSQAAGSDGSCFVATAAYGDGNHPDVVFLRRFRDTWLKRHALGRGFIAFYWTVGPVAAQYVRPGSRRQRFSKGCLSGLVKLIRKGLPHV